VQPGFEVGDAAGDAGQVLGVERDGLGLGDAGLLRGG
jgi:hypothetical protein